MDQDLNNSPRKLQIWLPLLFALMLVIGMLIGMQMRSTTPSVVIDSRIEQAPGALGQGKIEEVIRYVEAKYVDDVNREKLIQQAIDRILDNLDPHSNYITAEDLKEVNEQLEGNFDGIGIEFMVLEDTIIVVSPLAGGPSEQVGIQAGDKLIQIEDSLIAGINMNTDDIINMLRGERGSQVGISILRGQENELRRFTVTRDKIPMHSVDIAYMLDGKTGYIKINRFSATTYEEFMKGLEDLVENKGMEDLVIDLRHNPGGYLQQATNILSQLFKDQDKLLVYTKGRTVNRNDYKSTGRAFFEIGNVLVLIDEGSASASEILAGAIQDHDRGVVIGRRSFGKGLVQEQYKLRDGSALRLTVARYYTPSGRSIQKDYKDSEDYSSEVLERYSSGEMESENKIEIHDSTEYYTTGGRLVFGGGGISPDVFISIDTALLDDNYLSLRQHIPQFVYRYLEDNPSEFDYTLANFKNTYQVNRRFFDAFLDYASENGTKVARKDIPKIKAPLQRFIKARIAKHLYEDEGFYTIWNEDDSMIQKAMELLGQPDPLAVIKE